ncbi:collagenase, partial [Chitinimonas sp. BJB300]
DYTKFGRAVFKIDTNNGGYSLEGDATNVGNIQHFWAYHKNGVDGTNELEGQYIWNLKHEFIHYLDNVFNQGDYADFSNEEKRFVWWQEGVAEYFSKQNSYPDAIEAARKKTYTLSDIFNHSYDMSDYFGRAYTWGYLGVRFMFERHRNDIESMLVMLRNNQPAAYRKLIFSDIGTRYDSEFNQWLETVSVGGDFSGAKYGGGRNAATLNRGVGKITFGKDSEYKHNDTVQIYGNAYTYSLLERDKASGKGSTTGWRCNPLICNQTTPFRWSNQVGYWLPGSGGSTGSGTGGGGTTDGGTTNSTGQFDASKGYRNLDQAVFEGKTYTYSVLVDGKRSSEYPPVYGSTCAPITCTSQTPFRNSDNRVHAFWLEGQVATGGTTSGSGTTSGGGSSAVDTFDKFHQYRHGDKAVFHGQSYSFTVTVDGATTQTYPVYGSTCVPASCTPNQPWINVDGRSSAYWQ